MGPLPYDGVPTVSRREPFGPKATSLPGTAGLIILTEAASLVVDLPREESQWSNLLGENGSSSAHPAADRGSVSNLGKARVRCA